MKFLIDECLSPTLATIARKRGFPQSTHVSWLGLSSRIAEIEIQILQIDARRVEEAKDWLLVRRAIRTGMCS